LVAMMELFRLYLSLLFFRCLQYHYQRYIEGVGFFFTITFYILLLIVTVALVLGAVLSFFDGSLIIRKLIKDIFIFSSFSKQ